MDKFHKPHVNVNPVANQYTTNRERIIEFKAGSTGGLISFYIQDDGTATIHLYRLDPTMVTVSFDRGVLDGGKPPHVGLRGDSAYITPGSQPPLD